MNLSHLRLIDLTHTLTSDVPSWSGACGFHHELLHDYDACQTETKFRATQLQMFSGIGTHMDAPLHCFSDGKSIADLSLENLFVNCFVIDIPVNSPENYVLQADDILHFEKTHANVTGNSFVIVRTGWGKFWNDPTKYRNELVFPTVSADAAELLLARNVTGIGIDTLSPDNEKNGFAVHKIMLGTGKYIIENIANTHLLPCVGAIICAFPIKIKDGTEAPMRLVGIVTKEDKLN